MTPLMIFGSTALPALLAGVVCAIVLRVWRKDMCSAEQRSGSGGGGGWLVGGAIALGVVLSVGFVQERFLVVPSLKMGIEWWVAYFALLCACAAVVGGLKEWKTRARIAGRAALCLAGAAVVTVPLMRSGWFSTGIGLAWIGGLGVWMFAAVWLMERAGRRLPGCGSTALVHIFAGVASPVVLLWNNQTFSKMLGAIAGATFFIGVLTVWRSRRSISSGVGASVGTVGGVLTCTLCAAGYLYGWPGGPGGGAVAGAWLGGMFLTPIVGELPAIRKTKPWARLTMQMVLATLVGGVALGYAIAFGDIDELLKLMGLEL